MIDQNQTKSSRSSSCLLKRLEKEVEKLNHFSNETFTEWFIGRVLEIHFEEGYFRARLKDTSGFESIAEFDIETVFEDNLIAEQHLFPGAKFVFSLVTHNGSERPGTQNSGCFISPYECRKDIFPYIPTLED